MITLQKQITYAGELSKAPLKTINIEFRIPVYEFAATGLEERGIGERKLAGYATASIVHSLDTQNYRVVIQDWPSREQGKSVANNATRYYAQALQAGAIDDLIVGVDVHYRAAGNTEIGKESLDFICLPKLDLDLLKVTNTDAALSTARSLVAVNRMAVAQIRKQLALASIAISERVLLQTISLITDLSDDQPVIQNRLLADIRPWLALESKKRGTEDAFKAIPIIKKYLGTLYDFPLTIPEVQTLEITGTFTVAASSAPAVAIKDFLVFELVAELLESNADKVRVLRHRFNSKTAIQGASASFSFTAGQTIYRNALRSPIVVKVEGINGSVAWVREFRSDDPKLKNIEIEVVRQILNELVPLDKDAVRDKTKKLRGRVVTFSKDCSLKDLAVLVLAKKDVEASWKVVGAAITDTSGNFSMPYAFGKYSAAQALVSIVPKEPTDISMLISEGDETISDDFLYLLCRHPDCPPSPKGSDCDCTSFTKPNRLPDFADLIESGTYSQDIGGSCVNLTKPNRTISEFNYRAIVRTSDPEVANYVLNKIETDIETVDVSLAIALANGASLLYETMTTMKAQFQSSPYAGARIVIAALDAVGPHVMAVRDVLAQGQASITATSLTATLSHLDAIAAIIETHHARFAHEDLINLLATMEKILKAREALRGLVNLAIDTVGTLARYELIGSKSKAMRRPIDLDNPVAWQDAPDAGQYEAISQAVTVATGHILHYKALFKADGYSLGDLIYALPLAPGQKNKLWFLILHIRWLGLNPKRSPKTKDWQSVSLMRETLPIS